MVTRALEGAHIRRQNEGGDRVGWVGNQVIVPTELYLLPPRSLGFELYRSISNAYCIARTLQRCFSPIGETCEGTPGSITRNAA